MKTAEHEAADKLGLSKEQWNMRIRLQHMVYQFAGIDLVVDEDGYCGMEVNEAFKEVDNITK